MWSTFHLSPYAQVFLSQPWQTPLKWSQTHVRASRGLFMIRQSVTHRGCQFRRVFRSPFSLKMPPPQNRQSPRGNPHDSGFGGLRLVIFSKTGFLLTDYLAGIERTVSGDRGRDYGARLCDSVHLRFEPMELESSSLIGVASTRVWFGRDLLYVLEQRNSGVAGGIRTHVLGFADRPIASLGTATS